MVVYYFLVAVMPFSDPPLLHYLAGDATFRLIGGLCALYALLYLGQRKTLPHYFATWQSRLFAIFFLVAAFSFLTKSLQRFTESTIVIYSSQVILFFVTLTLVDSLRRLRWVLISASAAVAFGSIWVLREWMMFRNVYADFRPGWSVGDSNYFATSAVLCLPFIYLRFRHAELRWEKWFQLGALLLSLVALTLCASRGGFLGFIAAFLVVVWRSRHRVRNLALISLLVLVPALALPNSPIRRLLQPTHSEDESSQVRIEAWNAGRRMIKAHPLAGVGVGNFKGMMLRYRDPGVGANIMAHNSYVEVAAEMGLPQLLVFVGILLFAYRSFEQVRRSTKHLGPMFIQDAALGLEAGLVGHAIGALTASVEYQKLFWLVLFLSMCLPALAQDIAPADHRPAVRVPGTRPWRTAAIDTVAPASSRGRAVAPASSRHSSAIPPRWRG